MLAVENVYGLHPLIFILVILGIIVGIIWVFGNGPWRGRP